MRWYPRHDFLRLLELGESRSSHKGFVYPRSVFSSLLRPPLERGQVPELLHLLQEASTKACSGLPV